MRLIRPLSLVRFTNGLPVLTRSSISFVASVRPDRVNITIRRTALQKIENRALETYDVGASDRSWQLKVVRDQRPLTPIFIFRIEFEGGNLSGSAVMPVDEDASLVSIFDHDGGATSKHATVFLYPAPFFEYSLGEAVGKNKV